MVEKIKIISWISKGINRKLVFELIEVDKLKIPSEIFREASQINGKISIQNVSDILSDFKKRDLIKCINEEEKQGRLYKLTHLGKKVKVEI